MKVKDKCFPFGIPPEADTLLFCFHHAGGNAGQLRSWCGVKNDIAVVPVEYAGHGWPDGGEILQRTLRDCRGACR